MKYLFLLLLAFNVNAIDFKAKPVPNFIYKDTLGYNGTITQLDERSWELMTHTNDVCAGRPNSACRKVGLEYQTGKWFRDKFTRYSFNFTVDKFPMNNSPGS